MILGTRADHGLWSFLCGSFSSREPVRVRGGRHVWQEPTDCRLGNWARSGSDTASRHRDCRPGLASGVPAETSGSCSQLTDAQALCAALTGQVTIGGQDVACSATRRLADLVALHCAQAPTIQAVLTAAACLMGYGRTCIRSRPRLCVYLAGEGGVGRTVNMAHTTFPSSLGVV